MCGGKNVPPQRILLSTTSPTNYEKQIGFFIPTGAVHSIGAQNYAKLISNNDAFAKSVVTIPLGDFQYETLDILFLWTKIRTLTKPTWPTLSMSNPGA